LANGKNDKGLTKMWNDQDSTTEEVDESSFVVAEVVDVDLVEVGEVLIDLERETTIDILKGLFNLIFSFYIMVFCLVVQIHTNISLFIQASIDIVE